MARLVGVVAHGAQHHAGHVVLGGNLGHGRALHLHTVRVYLGGDGVLGGTVAHELVAGGDLARNGLHAHLFAGGHGGLDHLLIAGVFGGEGGGLGDHVVLGVVVDHGLAHHHVADADFGGHVAGDAGEDDALSAELGNQYLGGGGGVGLAHTGAADHHLLVTQHAPVVFHPGVGLDGHTVQQSAQLLHFVGHGAHDADDLHMLLLWIRR